MSMDFPNANAMFSGAVADEIGLLSPIATTPRSAERDSRRCRDHRGEGGRGVDLGGRRADAAPRIAVDGIGALMKAIHPKTRRPKRSGRSAPKTCCAGARRRCRRGVPRQLPSRQSAEGQEFDHRLKGEIDPSDAFYKQIDRLETRKAGEAPLANGERALLRNLLYLANATWKVGQVHRAIGEGDLSRINPPSGTGSSIPTTPA